MNVNQINIDTLNEIEECNSNSLNGYILLCMRRASPALICSG